MTQSRGADRTGSKHRASTLLHVTAIACVLIVGLRLSARAQSQQLISPKAGGEPATGTARITGTVTAAQTGAPIRGALVYISSAAVRRMARTDGNGRYEVKELPAGAYSSMVSKPGYVGSSYGQRGPFGVGRPIELDSGASLAGIDFRLSSTGAFSGKIQDQFGDGLANVTVSAVRRVVVGGAVQTAPATTTATNDLGEFRLYGLTPGRYYVVAAPPRTSPALGTSDSDAITYAPTYFPGTLEIETAEPLSLASGETRSDIRMSLSFSPARQISGSAFDSQGRPLAGQRLTATRLHSLGGLVTSTTVDQDGRFTVAGLAPGTYALAASRPARAGEPRDSSENASQVITVSTDNLEGVQLVTRRMVKIAGRLTFSRRTDDVPMRALRVICAPVETNPAIAQGGMAQVSDDGHFDVKVAPGIVRISVAGLPPSWIVKSVVVKGIDAASAGFDVDALGPDEVVVALTNEVVHLSGTVTDNRGEALGGVPVVIFPHDHDSWGPGTRAVRTERADRDGRFEFSGVPEGTYYLVAVDGIDPAEAAEKDTLERVASRSSSLTLRVGDERTFKLVAVNP